MPAKVEVSSYAQVYVHHFNSRSYEHIGHDLNPAKLAKLSATAHTQLSRKRRAHPKLPLGRLRCVVYDSRTVDIPSAKAICKWIEGNDLDHPQELTADHAVGPAFADLVKLYYTSHHFSIRRAWRGAIRDEILTHIDAAPVYFDEFVMVMECCKYDKSLCEAYQRNATDNESGDEDSKSPCPDRPQIAAWLRADGQWDHMEDIQDSVLHKNLKRKVDIARDWTFDWSLN